MNCPNTGPSRTRASKVKKMILRGLYLAWPPSGIIPVLCIGRTPFQIPSLTPCGPWEGQDMAPTPKRDGALRAHTLGGEAPLPDPHSLTQKRALHDLKEGTAGAPASRAPSEPDGPITG